jgi:hypothetical protein
MLRACFSTSATTKACRVAFQGRIDRIERAGLVPVLSAERLCGDMLYGAYDSARNARRLALTFPGARVLIVFREQRRMILSSYREYVSSGGLLGPEDYLRPPPPRFPHPWPFSPVHFEYDRLIALYRDLCGDTSVLALPYELFRNDPEDFVGRIIALTGGAPRPDAVASLPFSYVENPAWPAATLGARRRANVVLGGRLNPWAALDARTGLGGALSRSLRAVGSRAPDGLATSATRRLELTVAAATGDRYRASNRRTAELVGVDLAQLGYDVES